jgi:hypothetical protein
MMKITRNINHPEKKRTIHFIDQSNNKEVKVIIEKNTNSLVYVLIHADKDIVIKRGEIYDAPKLAPSQWDEK